MIRLSIPVRQSLARLTLPALVAAAFGVILLGKAEPRLTERARMALADAMTPIYGVLAEPVAGLRRAGDAVAGVFAMARENARLRRENESLRRWQSVALALDNENAQLKANLHWLPDAAPTYVTARVVADAGGVYARAVLLSAGANHGIAKGQIALDGRGLVGRVTEIGARSVRVLLITDINSRIPVVLENSRARAILVGTNGSRPRLLYWPEETPPVQGERVVTSAEANVFPAGLPVGVVQYAARNLPEVEPLARLDRLEMVRLFDYGQRGAAPPEISPAAHVAATTGKPDSIQRMAGPVPADPLAAGVTRGER